MAATASGVFRRTAIERSDQRVSWERTDQAFFSSGACHVLAWTCRDFYPDQGIALASMYLGDFEHPLHHVREVGYVGVRCVGLEP